MEHIYLDGQEFTRRVFDEDKDICAKVQNGLRQARKRAVLGNGIEDRVTHFQRAYVEAAGE
jgi:choline monooxygenase